MASIKSTAAKPAARKGMGNTPAPAATAEIPANLAGVVATTPTGAPKPTAAALAATMAAKAAAKGTSKAAPAPKAATTAKPTTAKAATPKAAPAAVVARTAATAARNAATQEMCLAYLAANAGTAYSVNQVEIGTGNGPTSGKIKTLRPALWALVKAGKVVGPDTGLRNSLGHKGFMVAKPTAPRKAASKAASK